MADTEKIIRKKYDVPIWHKSNLTIDEAVEYSGINQYTEMSIVEARCFFHALKEDRTNEEDSQKRNVGAACSPHGIHRACGLWHDHSLRRKRNSGVLYDFFPP